MPPKPKTIYVVIQDYDWQISPEKAFWNEGDAEAYARELYDEGPGLATYDVWEVEIDATRRQD